MVSRITKRFRSSYKGNVLAKLQDFRRRSVWAYLLASVLLGAGAPGLLGRFWVTAAGSFLGCCAVGIGVVYLGAYLQRNKTLFSAEVTFEEARILVQPDGPGQPAEAKDWRWILAWQESGTHFFLRIQKLPRLFLLLRKTALTPEEADTLRTWLARPRVAAPAAAI